MKKIIFNLLFVLLGLIFFSFNEPKSIEGTWIPLDEDRRAINEIFYFKKDSLIWQTGTYMPQSAIWYYKHHNTTLTLYNFVQEYKFTAFLINDDHLIINNKSYERRN